MNGTYHLDMTKDEWRVEVDLDDEAHGFGIGERLRAHSLDDDARERPGPRHGHARRAAGVPLRGQEAEASEAELVARELVANEDLSAEIAVTRWHPVAEEWQDATVLSLRAKRKSARRSAERRNASSEEAKDEDSYDWLVKAELASRDEAAELEDRLRGEGLPVHRRWRYVTVDVLTEEQANALELVCARRRLRPQSGSRRTRTTSRRPRSSCSESKL